MQWAICRPNNSSANVYECFFFSVCSSLDLSELAKAAKKKLQSVSMFAESLYWALVSALYLTLTNFPIFMQLSNHLFEELAMDVYDEVDRRETDAGKAELASKSCVVSLILSNLRWRCSYTRTSKPDTVDLALILLFAVWLATQNHSALVTETTVVPFLPVNPEYSSTRNQASQRYRTQNAILFPSAQIYSEVGFCWYDFVFLFLGATEARKI